MPANSPSILPERLLLFDGVCNLCDRSVQFVIRHDPQAKFKFAALQSVYAQRVLKAYPALHNMADQKGRHKQGSLIFILRDKAYTRSTAVLKIAAELGYPWKFSRILFILPKALRDLVYNYIARHRYRWYGRKDSCIIPAPELKARFMDQDGRPTK